MIWESFTEEERATLRRLLHLPAGSRLSEDEKDLRRRYWAAMKERSRRGEATMDNARINKEYHMWLRSNRLPVAPFDREHWLRFVREGRAK